MGVVVLHAHELHLALILLCQRPLRREVFGMQVMGHDLRHDREEPLEMLDPLTVGTQGLVVLQVSDVIADPGPIPLRDREGALQLGTAGERGTRDAQRQTGGDVAAGAPQEEHPSPATLTTESSVRVSIGRSCRRNRSAIDPSRWSASSSR
jgi:hypothetical protein